MSDKIKTVNKTRYANMDLLRILSMLMIVLFHSIIHSGVLEASEATSVSLQIWVRFTYMLTQVCVNCYVLISGYFLVQSKFRLQKLVVLWLETVFYSLIIKIIFLATGQMEFSLTSLLSCFVPILTGRYWFITIYFGMYLIFPFLNIAIKAMNHIQHLFLNLILFVLFSFIISIHPMIKGMNAGAGWGIAWFIVLYFSAAWIRLYYEPKGRKLRFLLFWIIISLIISCCYVGVNGKNSMLTSVFSNLYRYDSAVAYSSSICLLLLFINVNISNNFINRFILFISPATLGVYLIHDHSDFSPWIWNILNLPSRMNSMFFIIIQIFVVVLVFASCSFLDIIRRYTIGRIDNCVLVNSFCIVVQKVKNRLINRLEV